MKQYYFAALCLVCFFQAKNAISQNLAAPCGADYWREVALQDPEFFQKNEAFEQAMLKVFKQKKPSTGLPEQTKVLPTVVHIIHDGGPENISDAQVQQAIQWLNQALANQGSFNQGSGADCGIQLCLAQRTPDGLPTNGITRNQSPLTAMQLESQDLQVKNLNRWNPKDYVNIWLVRSICSNNYGCGVYGYAYYPFSHGSTIDGIVMEAGYVTEIGKVSGLAHEMGHYLGLYHTFEGGCTNNNCLVDGDRICDTPPDQSTAGVPCGDNLSSCSTDTQSGPFTTDQPDMSWNFMDYGILNCFHDYTPDQAIRMNAAVDGTRKSLLESKGCLPPCTANTVAAFNASATSVVVGTAVNFTNNSQNASAYSWTVNGTPFGSLSDASYTFLSPGIYTITLSAQPANSSLCSPDDAQVTIQVSCNVSAAFSVSDLAPDENETIFLSNTSQNGIQTEWFVNGVSQGTVLDSLVFNDAGAYEITLVTQNGPCQASLNLEIFVQEVCDGTNQLFQIAYQDATFKHFYGRKVLEMKDGNLLFVFDHAQNYGKIYLAKMSPGGQQIWAKSIGSDSTEFSNWGSAATTPDGGFVLSIGHGGFSHSVSVAKFSNDGELVWQRHFPNPMGAFYMNDIVVLADGKIAVCGWVYYSDIDGAAIFFAEFDSLGNLIFAREYDQVSSYLTDAQSIKPLVDGGFVVAGYGNGAFLMRLSALGDIVWSKSLGGFFLLDILVLNDTAMVACGESGERGWMIKISLDGDIIWDKRYTNPQNDEIRLDAILHDDAGGFVAAANNFDENAGILMRLDSMGEVIWSRQYEGVGSSFFHDIAKFQDKGYLLAGQTFLENGNFERAAWLLKTDRLGKTGDCSGEPYSLSAVSEIPQVGILNFIEVPAHLPENDSIQINDWQGLRDTICPFVCAVPIEICNNNLDDDGDGLFDCLDPDCNCMEDQCSPQQANHWYFGNSAGLDFSTEPPSVLNDGVTSAFSASATMSDAQGNLLFYTDGTKVYNRFHQPMPHSNNLAVGEPLIIPHPSNSSLFYLATTNPFGTNIQVVDIALDEGRGDLNVTVFGAGTQGLAAVKACSFNGYWILTLRGSSNVIPSAFWVTKVDENGLDPTAIISTTGQFLQEVQRLKISPDGKRIACSYDNFGKNYLSIYDFDPYTSGTVSNPRILKQYQLPYRVRGLEFSPNSRYLYASGNFPNNVKVLQYDLEAGDLMAIQNSVAIIETDPADVSTGLIQLAPNGKIYVPKIANVGLIDPSHFLDVIHNPDAAGAACQYQELGQELSTLGAGGTVFNGLCNSITSSFSKPYIAFPHNAPDTICQLNWPIFYQILNVQCKVDSITWQTENLSAQIQPNYQYATIRYLTPGNGRLIVTAHTPCGTSSDTLDVLVVAPLTQTINLGPDLVVCQNGVFSFNAGSGFAKYLWSDGTADSTVTTLFPGTYWVKAWDLCGNFQTDTITVSIAPNSVLDLGPNLPQQCSGFSASYQRPTNFESWQWSPNDFLSCADCPNVTLSPAASTRWIIVGQTAEGCISVDTLNATIRDTLLFSRDTFVCVGETLALFGTQLPADTTAEFFLPAPALGCDTLLTVNVLGIDNAASEVNVRICADAFFEYNGVLFPADTVAVFHFNSAVACDSAVTVRVNAYPALTLSLPMDTTIRIGASVLLDAEFVGAGTLDFAWTPTDGLSCFTCVNPLANPLDTITYTLSVTDLNGCTAQESVTVRVNEECRVRIPNAFTPNGDGANEVFRPVLDPCVRTVRLWKIMNRWGQTVFEQVNFSASDPNLGWDGNLEGKPQPSDVLIWVAEFEYFDGRKEAQSGEVSLIR